MAKRVGRNLTAALEQFDLSLHCLLEPHSLNSLKMSESLERMKVVHICMPLLP